jgi:transcriptional regulator with XRE-family HTH domain
MKIYISNPLFLQLTLLQNGFNQISFSKEIGITASYLNLLIHGKRNPSPQLAKKISELLNVKFNDLFTVKKV